MIPIVMKGLYHQQYHNQSFHVGVQITADNKYAVIS